MDYFKFASFCYLLCIFVLAMFVQEKSCATTYRRTSTAKWTCPPLTLTNGLTKLRSKGRVGRYMCNDGFKIVGERTATCVRGRWEGNVPICVKAGCLKMYAPSKGYMRDMYGGAVVTFYCDNGYSLNGSRNIWCNGILWNGTAPTCQVDNADPDMSCDFENEHLCGWTHDAQHNFDWQRHHFSTPSGHVDTGPSFDHTKGKGRDGYYMYIESSVPRVVNDTARLISPVYQAVNSKDACFIFWYHMYGRAIGSLRVYQKPENVNLSSLKPLFSKSGDQTNQWFRGLVRLNETTTPFQIIMEGVRGPGYVSDIAIDDVQLTNGTGCLKPVVDTSQSTLMRTETGGGGEVFDDAQSCRSRCINHPNLSTLPPSNNSAAEGPVMVMCECHVGCLDNRTCCPDYSSYCILAKVPPSLPAPPRLKFRTIASVHYYPLSPPRTTLPIPPPLPPLPPKPTLMTSQKPPSPTRTNDSSQNTDVFKRPTTPETSSLGDSSVVPTSQPFSEPPPTNLGTNVDETYPGVTDIIEEQLPSTMMDTVSPEPPEASALPQSPTADETSTSIAINVDDGPLLETTLVPIVPTTTQITTKTLHLTTNPKEPPPTKPTVVTNKNTSPASQTTTQTPTTLIRIPVKQITVQQSDSTTTQTMTTTIPRKPTTPKRAKTYPPRKPYFPKKTIATTTSTTQTPTTTKNQRTTKNRMMYYPNSSGDKANVAETNYLLKKELINQPKRISGIPWPQTQQVTKDSPTASASMVIGIVGGIALLLVAFGVVAFAVVRRRRVAGGRSSMSDDSDVRFLTADEVLDFNIARPSEEDDRCS